MELKHWKQTYDCKNKTSKEEMDELIRTIQDGTNELKNEEVLIKIGTYSPSQNCDGAAKGYFDIASKIGAIRSELTEDLFIITLKPLYYNGIEESSDLEDWVKRLLGSKNNSFDDAQKEWISTKIKDEDFIDEVFEKVKYLEEHFHS